MGLQLAATVPLFACAEDMTVEAWNGAAEELTGIPAAQALGEPCWRVLAGRDDAGGVVCHPQCSQARLARRAWPVARHEMHVRAAKGRRRVAVDTVSICDEGRSLTLHIMRDASVPAGRRATRAAVSPRLTARQLEVLRMLAQGVRACAIAADLGLAETTVRNHIRAVLLELGAHSQLEAVHQARLHGML